ncbi:hypothetical protein HanIR_Chr15g0765981 [Helianthus annuus]|nr:hypothetical protein HanIR_Chr15g0765981 [Helianthus annuus]
MFRNSDLKFTRAPLDYTQTAEFGVMFKSVVLQEEHPRSYPCPKMAFDSTEPLLCHRIPLLPASCFLHFQSHNPYTFQSLNFPIE